MPVAGKARSRYNATFAAMRAGSRQPFPNRGDAEASFFGERHHMRIRHFCFTALLVAALSGALGTAGEPTPFQQFLAAKELDRNLDSVHFKFQWGEGREEGDSAPLMLTMQNKYIFKDGFVAEGETIRGIGHPSGRLPPMMMVVHLKDGFSYAKRNMSDSSRKVKRAAAPIPAEVPLGRHIPSEERLIASQERTGNIMRFTVDVEAVNALTNEKTADMRWEKNAFEIELNEDGTIRKAASSGRFVRIRDGKEIRLRYRDSTEILQRGNVGVSFPSDLDTYTEIQDNPSANGGSGKDAP